MTYEQIPVAIASGASTFALGLAIIRHLVNKNGKLEDSRDALRKENTNLLAKTTEVITINNHALGDNGRRLDEIERAIRELEKEVSNHRRGGSRDT